MKNVAITTILASLVASLSGCALDVESVDADLVGSELVAETAQAVSDATLASYRSMSAGSGVTCGIRNDGGVACWGTNGVGNLGIGTIGGGYSGNYPTPQNVVGLSGATVLSLSTTYATTCALLADKTVRCWGDNSSGQIGDGTTTNRHTPTQMSGVTDAIAVAAGMSHTCVLHEDTTVSCVGNNYRAQLGDGTTTNRLSLTPVPGLSGVTQILAGAEHTCAATAAGVYCWGRTDDYQSGVMNAIHVANPHLISLPSAVTSLAMGYSHTCASLDDGTVRCWGSNYHGQMGTGQSFSQLNKTASPVTVQGLSDVVMLGGGGYGHHVCALRAGGTVSCWGNDNYGQLGDGVAVPSYSVQRSPVATLNLTGLDEVVIGAYFSCARKPDGSAYCFGANYSGQLGNNQYFVQGTGTATQVVNFP